MNNNLADIFKAYDVRGKVGSELNAAIAGKIGQAFAAWLPEAGAVAVGRDMRADSAELATAFIDGVRKQGHDVWDLGEVTSDMSCFAVGKYNLAGSAMITASHNNSEYNGIKLYRDKVTPIGLDSGLDQIRDAVLSDKPIPLAKETGSYQEKNIVDDWVNHCLTFVRELKPFHIAIDAGNGMAGSIVPHILPKLPLTVERLYFELDGSFPNHEANPQKIETLSSLIEIIKNKKLDFGIAFDGDGDRAGFVDDLGRPVLGTDLISIVAKYYLAKYPGAKIVHEVRTSRATQELIREWGGTPVRTKAGRIEIGRVLREVGAPFGGETTGHFFFTENYDADAALITALVVMQAISDSGKKLSALVNDYHRYAIIPEINFEVKDKNAVLAKLKQVFQDGKQDELDGLTVNYPDYWFNLRASNTEPLMRLNAEAKTSSQLDDLVAKITQLINSL